MQLPYLPPNFLCSGALLHLLQRNVCNERFH